MQKQEMLQVQEAGEGEGCPEASQKQIENDRFQIPDTMENVARVLGGRPPEIKQEDRD